MGWVDGDGGEQRVDFAVEIGLGLGALFFGQLFPLQKADTLLAQFGKELAVPAAVLRGYEVVNFCRQVFQRGLGREAVIARFGVSVFCALEQAGEADFDVLVQVAAGDGEEFDPF